MFLWCGGGLEYLVFNSEAVISARRRMLWLVQLSEAGDICRDVSDFFMRFPELGDGCGGRETEATERTGS